MHFEIVTAWKPHLPLNPVQTTSSKFEYEPIVCGTFLKHDLVLKRTLEQILADLFRIRELVIADAIRVSKVIDGTNYHMSLPMLTEAELTAPYEPEPVKPEPVIEPEGSDEVPPAQEEVSGDAVEETTPVPVEPVAPLITPPTEEPAPAPAPEAPKAPKAERKKKQKQE